MPQLAFSRAILTLATDTPLSALGWQYEFLPWPAQVKIGVRTTATGVTAAIFTGTQTIQETSPVLSRVTADATPSELNTPCIYFIGMSGDRLKIVLVNMTGGTLTVNILIVV